MSTHRSVRPSMPYYPQEDIQPWTLDSATLSPYGQQIKQDKKPTITGKMQLSVRVKENGKEGREGWFADNLRKYEQAKQKQMSNRSSNINFIDLNKQSLNQQFNFVHNNFIQSKSSTPKHNNQSPTSKGIPLKIQYEPIALSLMMYIDQNAKKKKRGRQIISEWIGGDKKLIGSIHNTPNKQSKEAVHTPIKQIAPNTIESKGKESLESITRQSNKVNANNRITVSGMVIPPTPGIRNFYTSHSTRKKPSPHHLILDNTSYHQYQGFQVPRIHRRTVSSYSTIREKKRKQLIIS